MGILLIMINPDLAKIQTESGLARPLTGKTTKKKLNAAPVRHLPLLDDGYLMRIAASGWAQLHTNLKMLRYAQH